MKIEDNKPIQDYCYKNFPIIPNDNIDKDCQPEPHEPVQEVPQKNKPKYFFLKLLILIYLLNCF